MTEKKYDIAELKAGGILKQKEPELFSIRLKVIGGLMEARHLDALSAISKKYGRGEVHLTVRQGMEIPDVNIADLDDLKADLAACGLELGACGPRIRTITACRGGACPHGQIDTQEVARRAAEALPWEKQTPNKFKIAVTGCPTSCIKPQENDLGIMGVTLKEHHPDLCTLCGLCEAACPVPGTLRVDGDRLLYDAERCIRCSACTDVCPSDSWEKTGAAYAVSVGGKMGSTPIMGVEVTTVGTIDELIALILETIDWYVEHAEKRERLGATLKRLGLEKFRAFIEDAGYRAPRPGAELAAADGRG